MPGGWKAAILFFFRFPKSFCLFSVPFDSVVYRQIGTNIFLAFVISLHFFYVVHIELTGAGLPSNQGCSYKGNLNEKCLVHWSKQLFVFFNISIRILPIMQLRIVFVKSTDLRDISFSRRAHSDRRRRERDIFCSSSWTRDLYIKDILRIEHNWRGINLHSVCVYIKHLFDVCAGLRQKTAISGGIYRKGGGRRFQTEWFPITETNAISLKAPFWPGSRRRSHHYEALQQQQQQLQQVAENHNRNRVSHDEGSYRCHYYPDRTFSPFRAIQSPNW